MAEHKVKIHELIEQKYKEHFLWATLWAAYGDMAVNKMNTFLIVSQECRAK